jgi:ADP-ribose pyrophosphatase YjhB (NUDIX family)
MDLKVSLRVSVVALFAWEDEVLLLHQVTPPEPNCWDLPGGGLEPAEDLISGLRREVREEIGLSHFQVERLLTVAEAFYRLSENQQLHKLDIIYQCSTEVKPTQFYSIDKQEVGPLGIRWIPVSELAPDQCASRVWRALQAAGLVPLPE